MPLAVVLAEVRAARDLVVLPNSWYALLSTSWTYRERGGQPRDRMKGGEGRRRSRQPRDRMKGEGEEEERIEDGGEGYMNRDEGKRGKERRTRVERERKKWGDIQSKDEGASEET